MPSALMNRRRMLGQTVPVGVVRGLSLAGLLKARAVQAAATAGVRAEATAASAPAIRSCIFVFYYGGPSHLDTYDLKPNAASTVRCEFNSISTTLPDIQIC